MATAITHISPLRRASHEAETSVWALTHFPLSHSYITHSRPETFVFEGSGTGEQSTTVLREAIRPLRVSTDGLPDFIGHTHSLSQSLTLLT